MVKGDVRAALTVPKAMDSIDISNLQSLHTQYLYSVGTKYCYTPRLGIESPGD